jgi:hypothetical protein
LTELLSGGFSPEIHWLHSYVTDDKIYFVYIAPDTGILCEQAPPRWIPAPGVCCPP